MTEQPIDAQSRELAVVDEQPPQSLAIFGSDDPAIALERAVRLANVLKDLIVKQGYAKKIGRGDREFVEVGGWQALGAFLDTFAETEWSRAIDRGYESRVVLKRRGQVVGAAESICTRDERSWSNRDDFALKSMSQTRAIGKAFRQSFGWIMTIAGYEATPAEEMVNDTAPKPKPAPAAQETPAGPIPEAERRERNLKAVMALCRQRGVSDPQRYALSRKLFAREHTADLNAEQLKMLWGEIKTATEIGAIDAESTPSPRG